MSEDHQVTADETADGVVLSFEESIYPKDAVGGGLVEAWSRSRYPGALIRRHVERQGIRVLDLLDYMNKPEHAGAYFFRQDGHLNGAGNAVMAKAILGELVE